MSISLAGWLTDNRETLLPRWTALIEDAHTPANGNGVVASQMAHEDDMPVDVVAHPDEHRVLLASIYEGLISAARGDRAPLDECLRLLRAFRTRPGEDELSEQLALAFTLRRVVWETLFRNGRGGAKNGSAAEQRQLMDELEELLEYTTVSMAAQWTTSAKVVARELDETKLLVESLYHEAEAADRTTLQVSILNQIAQGLSATLDPAQQVAIVGEKLHGALEITHLTIWLLDAETGVLYAAGAWGSDQEA